MAYNDVIENIDFHPPFACRREVARSNQRRGHRRVNTTETTSADA
jgi:hypothetical protein